MMGKCSEDDCAHTSSSAPYRSCLRCRWRARALDELYHLSHRPSLDHQLALLLYPYTMSATHYRYR